MTRLTEQDYVRAAFQLCCDEKAVKAVCKVESSGSGFFPDGTPKTLFEGHKFYLYTKGVFAATHPDLCYRVWTKKYYGKTWHEEQERLNRALRLHPEAALMSASWGLFQIMGFNFALCGFSSVGEFVKAMKESEGRQLDAFVQYVIHAGLAEALREQRWADFARRYNGADFRANRYDFKLAQAYQAARST